MINFYKIKGFNIHSVTRTGRTGGGVLVYSRETLKARLNDTECIQNMKSAECVSIALDSESDPIYLLCIYRPPKINKQDKTRQFLEELRKVLENLPIKNNLIICGDININLLKSQDCRVMEYETLLAEFGLIKCINKITRKEIMKGNVVESCLDHIYIRAPSAQINSAVIRQKISDHFLVSAAVQWNRATQNSVRAGNSASRGRGPSADDRSGRNMPTASCRRVLDNRLVRERLLSTDFKALLSIECPIELYNSLTQLFIEIYNDCYKTVNVSISSRNKSWVTDYLKDLIKERDRLFKVWCNDPKNMIKRLEYTKYRNKCYKTITKCSNEYDKQSIINCNKNIKKIWDRINILLGNSKQSLDTVILSNMQAQGSTKDIADGFATTFDEEIQQIKHICNDKWLSRHSYVQKPDINMRWQPVTHKYVAKIIKNMDANKSPGSDLIRMSDLKIVANEISPVVAKLINLSVEKHKFPKKLKEAIIRPIYKKGNRKLYSNYRPIAILSSIDKIIEKCIINQLGTYLRTHNIINKSQHGFQKAKSTNTLLSNFTNEINNYLNDKKFVVAIFFDYKKAFDTLETNTLITSLEECGVEKPLKEWFRDYLTSRSYRVKIGDTLSDEKMVRCGVPQGSGSGPVCYLMHVNSLCNVLQHCSAHMFADDLCAMRAGTDLAETCRLVQQDVDAVVKWSHDNGIVLNTDKTQYIIIHSPYLPLKDNPLPLYTHTFGCIHGGLVNCGCKPIQRVSCVTYLGVKVDEHFSWKEHIDFLCNKLKTVLSKFYHLSYRVPTSTLKILYSCMVESIIDYALDCYGLTFKSHIEKLENIQIRFLKLLVDKKTKNKHKTDYYKLYKICKVLPVSIKHKYLLATNSHGNRERNSLLTNVSNSYNTRTMSSGKYVVPRVNNVYGDRTLEKRVPYVLNSLPDDIRNENRKNKFKIKLKKHLLSTLP
ncbi:uncharacterized protein LOC124642082 [Helicoverpa zea]|uniref:uncharacterized protein LOC124634166 n=1 Tax=Helicoverpa zea TaxID=7113 RepID=UPI001F566764|nr:uncharacterized protein LOC124634166 [Helicoverpa zea]XP_047036341.1 uncharacterized protein LOC124642082 [Helicoverpa zea]